MTTYTRNDSLLNDGQDEKSKSLEQVSPSKRSMTNLAVRIITGLLLLPIVIFITFQGGNLLLAFTLVLGLIGSIEYYHMEQRWTGHGSNTWLALPIIVAVVLGFYTHQLILIIVPLVLISLIAWAIEYWRWGASMKGSVKRAWTTLFGVLYLGLPIGMLLMVQAAEPHGLHWLYAIFLATWGADSFAYLAGRAFGKTPLAPSLSPKKTVEGAIGGIFGGIFFPALVLLQIQALDVSAVGLLILAPFVAIFGDLFESWLKRTCAVKDSGVKGLNPLPGHGGVLDRVDAMLWVIVLFYVYLSIIGVVSF